MEGNEFHELLLNLGMDLMLRASDLLNLKVSDVLNESGSVKKEVRVKMKKTKKTTLNLTLSKNSIAVIKKYLLERKREDFIFQESLMRLIEFLMLLFSLSLSLSRCIYIYIYI